MRGMDIGELVLDFRQRYVPQRPIEMRPERKDVDLHRLPTEEIHRLMVPISDPSYHPHFPFYHGALPYEGPRHM